MSEADIPWQVVPFLWGVELVASDAHPGLKAAINTARAVLWRRACRAASFPESTRPDGEPSA